jgi:hypothetical protein
MQQDTDFDEQLTYIKEEGQVNMNMIKQHDVVRNSFISGD